MSDYDSKIIRKRLKIRGAVQGVGFRYRTTHAARSLGATGWVRNDWDGGVSMEIQCTEETIDKVLQMVDKGMFVRMDSIDAHEIPVVEGERDFIEILFV